MSNWLLFVLLTVVVLVNVYFTYRRTNDLDDKGRMLLAASQLIYLAFIGFVFLLGFVLNATGIVKAMQSGSATTQYIVMIAVIVVVLAVMLFFKSKLEKKIRAEHKLDNID